jgi:ArsR family transcriptional regulator
LLSRDGSVIFFISMNVDMKLDRPAGPSAAACCAPATGVNDALDAERLASIAKALTDPLRIRLLDAVRRAKRPVCQCELLQLFDVPQPTLSHHLGRLAAAGLVDVERRHRWAYYTVADDKLKELSQWMR